MSQLVSTLLKEMHYGDQLMHWSNLCFSFLEDLSSKVALGKFTVRLNRCSKLLRDAALFSTRAKFLVFPAPNQNEAKTSIVLNAAFPLVPINFKVPLVEKNLVLPSRIVRTSKTAHILNSQHEVGTTYKNAQTS